MKKNIHPELIVAAGALVWGLFWIPLRAFERLGLDPSLITISQFVAPLVFLFPFAIIKKLQGQTVGLEQYTTGLLVGIAFVLYCESLLLTDVVRALILFYVMPAWATLIEVGLMRRRITLWRCVALVLSLCGLVTILGIDLSFSLSLNLGDALALISGIAFAFGAMKVRQDPQVNVFSQVFAFFFYGSLVAMLLLVIPQTAPARIPNKELLLTLIPWITLMTVAFLLPVMWSVYWGSKHVDPGRLGILLQLEAVVGIGSAAVLTGEPFGLREVTGALLVLSAGLVEVLANNSSMQGTGQSSYPD